MYNIRNAVKLRGMVYVLDGYIQRGNSTPWRDPMICCNYGGIKVSNTGGVNNRSVNTNHSSVWIDHKMVLRPAISQRVGHPPIDSVVCIRGRDGIHTGTLTSMESHTGKRISERLPITQFDRSLSSEPVICFIPFHIGPTTVWN